MFFTLLVFREVYLILCASYLFFTCGMLFFFLQGTNSQKVYFMIFERGPRAFVEATCQTLTRLRSIGSPIQDLLHSASDMVSTKLDALTSMQHCLAAFLAEVCYNKAETVL